MVPNNTPEAGSSTAAGVAVIVTVHAVQDGSEFSVKKEPEFAVESLVAPNAMLLPVVAQNASVSRPGHANRIVTTPSLTKQRKTP
jgi:hypothetical protein